MSLDVLSIISALKKFPYLKMSTSNFLNSCEEQIKRVGTISDKQFLALQEVAQQYGVVPRQSQLGSSNSGNATKPHSSIKDQWEGFDSIFSQEDRDYLFKYVKQAAMGVLPRQDIEMFTQILDECIKKKDIVRARLLFKESKLNEHF